MVKCPNKQSDLYKRLINQLPEREVYKIYTILNSTEFDQWYGDGIRDKDNNPILDKYFVAHSTINPPHGFFKKIQFKSKSELEKFLSSNRTEGISKLGNSYYVSKNNRIQGLKYIKALESNYPGMIKTHQYWSDSDALGSTDQSMPVMRIMINDNYFANDFYNAPKVVKVTKIDSRDYIIRRLHEFNQRIFDKIKDAKKDKNAADIIKYQTLYDKNHENIATLQSERTIAAAVNQAKNDLKYVQSVLENPDPNESDLIEAGRLIELYANISKVDSKSALITAEDLVPQSIVKLDADGNEYIDTDISQLTKDIQSLGNQFDSQLVKYNGILKRLATQEFNSTFDREITEDELFEATKDLSAFAKARGTNSVNNKLINLLSTIRSAAVNRSNEETYQDNKERNDKLEGLKKSNLFIRLGRVKFMKLLWQKDVNGKETGGLINKFSDSYWRFIKNYGADLRSKDKTKITRAKQRHYNNHEYVNYFETEEQKQAEIDRLTPIIGEEAAVGLVNEQEIKFEDYRELKETKFEDIDASDISLEDKQFEKDKWVIENSPEETIKSLKSGLNSPNPKGGFFFNSFEFVRSIPLKITRDGNETEWYDKDFELIESDPIALEYHHYVKNKIKELLKFYPQSYLDEKGIHKGFIPQIKEGLLHEFKQNGLTSGLKGAKEIGKDWFTIKTFSRSYDHIDPGTGTTINTLNISLLSPKFRTVDGGKIVDTKDIVTDIDDVLSAFIPVTNAYKHKARIESSYNLIAESTKLLEGVEVSPSGTIVRNGKINEAVSDKGHLTRLKEIINFEIDTFYGTHQSKQEKAIAGKILSKDEKAELAVIEQELLEVTEQLENPELLTEEEEEKLKSKKINLEGQKSDLGRNISPTKSVKSVLKWYQLLAQGWNIHSPVIELVYGYMSNFIHASGQGDFTNKQIKKAYGIALTNSKKFKNLVDKFNMVGEVVENDKNGFSNSKNSAFSMKSVFKPYYLQKISDRISKGSAGIAVLLNTEITDKEGNVSNLYDAFDENGELKEQFQTEENLSKWTFNLDSTNINEIQRLRAKINEVNIRNMGNYDPNQPIPINSHAAGQAVLQFRRWLLEGVAQRFEGERESPTLKRTIKGRYVTYKDIVMSPDKGVKTLASSLFLLMSRKLMLRSVSNEELVNIGIESEVDIENMRKNATGLMITIMVWMALLLLKSAYADDEDKDFSEMKFLMNMGGRIQSDLWFYANPGEANNFLGNIVPSMRLYDKIGLWSEAVSYKMFPDLNPEFSPTFEKGELKGWDKSLIRTGELIPGSSSLIKAYRLGTKIM